LKVADRLTVSSGYPFEETFGYARAVRVGDHVYVSGTTARGDDLSRDAYTQASGAIGVIAEALRQAGADLDHVVRTVVYITDMADMDAVARAHGEVFRAVHPASTLVKVAGLTPSSARVEIEVTAIIRA
jgi:enamine deaminase RidA (YjgF/YER057c/UK114 family)